MTTKKPRGIRMYDDLWSAITEDAQRLGISVNRYVETALARELEKSPRKCFYCGAPGDTEMVAAVTRSDPQGVSLDDLFSEMAETGNLRERAFTPATLSVTVCHDHERSLGEAMVREYGVCSDWPLGKADYTRRAPEDPAVIDDMSRMLPSGGQQGHGGSAQPVE